MNKYIMTILAAPVIAAATPAAAQNYPSAQGHYNNQGNENLTARIDQLRVRLQAGVQNGSITRREASPIREQIRQVNQLERQYRVNGLSPQERADLQQRVRFVRQQLRAADNGANGRYAQWETEDGYNQGYQQGYGQGYQPYQQGYGQAPQQGGIAGLINQVLGGGGLQVGQRVSGNLYAVPYQHQSHYRDGNGIYYRSDGRRIYQIDARNHTVLRIFTM